MTLSSRDKAFFLLALYARGAKASALFARVPQAAAEMQKLFEPLKDRREKEMRAVARYELRKIAHPRSTSYLGEIHDDWLSEFIASESPLIISVLLRQLPADRVAGILARLPKEVSSSLPRLSETYAVPKRLGELLQARFEQRFATPREPVRPGDHPVRSISALPSRSVTTFFMELGYREIAIGLGSLPEDARGLVMGRLGETDRQRVEFFLAQGMDLPSQRLRRAQMHLVSKGIDPNRPQSFVRSLGYLLFSKAFLPADQADFRILMLKMSRPEAQELRAMVDEAAAKNSDASVIPYREDLITALHAIVLQ